MLIVRRQRAKYRVGCFLSIVAQPLILLLNNVLSIAGRRTGCRCLSANLPCVPALSSASNSRYCPTFKTPLLITCVPLVATPATENNMPAFPSRKAERYVNCPENWSMHELVGVCLLPLPRKPAVDTLFGACAV